MYECMYVCMYVCIYIYIPCCTYLCVHIPILLDWLNKRQADPPAKKRQCLGSFRLMWDGAGKGTLLQWYHAKGGAPKRDLFLVCYPSNYCIQYTVVIPSSKLT